MGGKLASSTCARRARARGGSAASLWLSARVPLSATACGGSAGRAVQPRRDKRGEGRALLIARHPRLVVRWEPAQPYPARGAFPERIAGRLLDRTCTLTDS